MSEFLQHLVNTLILGGTYALLGIGLTLIFGIMNVVNFTHGVLYTFGAYMMFLVTQQLGVNFFLALPIAAGIQMLIRELRVELPGEAAPQDEAKKLDERATKVYEKLSEGASAAEASVVADDVAHIVKRTETKKPEARPTD